MVLVHWVGGIESIHTTTGVSNLDRYAVEEDAGSLGTRRTSKQAGERTNERAKPSKEANLQIHSTAKNSVLGRRMTVPRRSRGRSTRTSLLLLLLRRNIHIRIKSTQMSMMMILSRSLLLLHLFVGDVVRVLRRGRGTATAVVAAMVYRSFLLLELTFGELGDGKVERLGTACLC